ncbi:hypothetical protein ACGF5F_32415 [Streptomyces sp. NPDC047821]|uniref:hypothetical protein n=1 Tax=Streptomyces sp. NPDC047821 TaxID=3365488 RepID=UPI003715CEB2
MSDRANTPDVRNPDGSLTIRMKRACNGCGQYVGDADDRDVDEHGNLTDVRAECSHCRPLVELEAAGCQTWHLTPRSIGRIDDAIDRDGRYAKGYWEDVNGKLTVTGLRLGSGPDRIVAKFGDWVIRHLDGTWAVHKAPDSAS